MASILIIDDDINLCRILSAEVGFQGHEAVASNSLKEGYELAISGQFDVVFLDVRLPDGNGLDILPAIRKAEEAPDVIIMTGTGDPDGAETAIKNGAWDYIQKPSSLAQMMLPMIRALDYRKARQSARASTILDLDGIIGRSPQLRVCLDLLAQAANSVANVLLEGETGTGKEVFALAIHRNSRRSKGPFVVVDCGAMTESLVESVLFGHEKGAFTGADRQRTGLVKTADRGTLFLDEIGELPLNIQRSMLRVLQEHRFRPVGADMEIESDFRLIAATHRDIEEMVQKGQFREDLWHRLRGIMIHLPPLRERAGDLRELAAHTVSRTCDRYKIKTKGISPDLLDVLSAYSWPGNIRELQHTIERTIAHSIDIPVLYPEHLPIEIRAIAARSAFTHKEELTPQQQEAPVEPFPTLKNYENQVKEKYLTELIHRARGNAGEACRLSGMSRSNLYNLLKTFKKSLTG